MKILLIYYTGTYNTRYLTGKVKERFTERGDEVDTVEIDCNTPPCSTEGYDLVGFSYPIYGFNAPLPFDRYVAKLKFPEGQKYFIYKNSGEVLAMNNASSRILIKKMKRDGAVLAGEYHFVMPYNIHFPFERDFVREILYMNGKLLDIMMHDLDLGIVKRIPSNLIYNMGAFFVGIQKIGGDVNSFLYKVDEKKCIDCGLCIKRCPHDNIYRQNGKIKFHHHCDMCMRCSFFCPTDAIRIGFLDGWRVNGAYDLAAMEKDGKPDVPYITSESRSFYKCYISYFEKINKEHEKIFGKSEEKEPIL
jgi:NAD-dependent dihydropyrimidine dehydrogenase PreA subunit